MTALKNFGLIPAVLLAFSFGCIKRSEKITIFQDGRITLETEIKGGPGDVHNGDAMPTAESGWQVSDKIETKDDGEQELIRTATLEIAAGQPLPTSYAPPNSRLDMIALQFPTTLMIEQRDEGTYYHFMRVYQRREYATVQYWQDKVMQSDEIKAITQKEPQDLTDPERVKIARAFIDVEANQTASFIEQVGLAMPKLVSQHALLKARRSAMKVYSSKDLFDRVIELLVRDDDDDAEEVEQIERELRAQVRSAVEAALSSAQVKHTVIEQFLDGYQLAREAFEVTGDLGDESWLVSVEMPGRIMAHNSSQALLRPVEEQDAVRKMAISATVAIEKDGELKPVTSIHEYESRSGKVAWEFDGKALRDRDMVLMATSFVPNESE